MIGAAGIEFTLIPEGGFWMGSTEAEIAEAFENTRKYSEYAQIQWFDNEGPRRWVEISKPFWMGRFQVTQAQWTAVMGDNPSFFKDCPDCPVENVSWKDCQAFILRLNALKDGITYALPTEAQWEYACRAGTTTLYSFGQAMTTEQANFNGEDRYGDFPPGQYRRRTIPVGSLNAPNPWGLHDMHGNVAEWCADRYDPAFYRTGPVMDPKGPRGGDTRVVRGGSWRYGLMNVRSANRTKSRPDRRDSTIGFRLVAVKKSGVSSRAFGVKAKNDET